MSKSKPDVIIIEKEYFNGRWPFNLDWVEIVKRYACISLKISGEYFYLTGATTHKDVKDLSDSNYWLDNKDIPGTKVSLSDFIKYTNKILN